MSTQTTPISDQEQRPRKQMRKGTHSCLECRRRKIRCVFIPGAQLCNGCTSRGTPCTGQEYADESFHAPKKRKNVHDRVGELEGMISQVLERLDTKGGGSKLTQSEISAAEALKSLQAELLPSKLASSHVSASQTASPIALTPEDSDPAFAHSHRFDDAPLLSIFNNDIIQQEDVSPGDSNLPAATAESQLLSEEKKTRVLKALRALAPSVEDLASILEASQTFDGQSWWNDGCERTLPDYLGLKYEGVKTDQMESLREYIHQSLNSNSVAVIAKIVVCLAISIQQLPKSFDFTKTNLPASPEALQKHYITCVETLLASDDGFAGTIEGVECMMMQSKFWVNAGVPRKAWLIFRRAISFGQLLGLHHQSSDPNDVQSLRRRNLWMQIWQGDRVISLLLGLPYAVPNSIVDRKLPAFNEAVESGSTPMMVKLSIITGHIIDRNQNRSCMTFSETLKIDQELEDCKSMMPQSWWETPPGPELSPNTSYGMFASKFWFHTIRKLLHLPFMHKSFSDRRFEYSRIAAHDSSREMIRLYRSLRASQAPLLIMSNVVDFLVLTAAMIVFLHILGTSNTPHLQDSEQQEEDWDILAGITEDMKRVSEKINSSVATQASRLLEDLYQGRYGCEPCDDITYEAIIPYFGKFKIGPGKKFVGRQRSSVPTPTSSINQQLQTPPESTANLTGSEFKTDAPPLYDGYFEPLQDDASLWQDGAGGDHWTSMLNANLYDDWSWFLNGTETAGV